MALRVSTMRSADWAIHVLVGGGDEDAVVTLDVLGGEGDGFAPGEMGVLAGLADDGEVVVVVVHRRAAPLVKRKILFLPHPSSSSFRVYENIMQCITMVFPGARFTWFRFFVIVWNVHERCHAYKYWRRLRWTTILRKVARKGLARP